MGQTHRWSVFKHADQVSSEVTVTDSGREGLHGRQRVTIPWRIVMTLCRSGYHLLMQTFAISSLYMEYSIAFFCPVTVVIC